MRRFLTILCPALLTSACLHAQKADGTDFGYYIGGSGYEQVRDITTDDSGNVYITGGTSSADFFTTEGAYSRKLQKGGDHVMDAFIMKYDSKGKLLWSTLFGGPDYDRAYAIEVDSKGYIYIAGRAGKRLPVTRGAFQTTFAGDTNANRLYGKQDGFVARFSPDGSRLIWCSYFGGPDRGFIRDLAVDSRGDVYIVATEASADYPFVKAGALQSRRGGRYDGIVAKISSEGDRVIWATYLGGAEDDFIGPSVRVNHLDEIVVCGTTTSSDLPTTPNAFDKTYNGAGDIYIAAISNDGGRLLFGTYLGGRGEDGTETHNLAIDNEGHIVVAATTSSEDFPVTPGAYQPAYGGSGRFGEGMYTNYPYDGFVARLSPDGSQLMAATYLGGEAGEGLEGVAIGADGSIWCGGSSYTTIMPLPGGGTATNHGDADQIVAGLDKDLQQLIFFRFVGGEGTDYGRTLCTGPDGRILIGGETRSANFPARNHFHGGERDGCVEWGRYTRKQ